MTIRVSAELFDLAYTAVSKEETRYYLNGVHIEAHPVKGALLVSTDGHRMVCIHDAEGVCETPAIVKLPAYVRRLCKDKKASLGIDRAILEVDAGQNSATVIVETTTPQGSVTRTTPLVTAHNVLIEGTFPDWRRVIPQGEMEPMHLSAFNPRLLADLGAFGKKFATGGFSGKGAMYFLRQKGKDGIDPTLVRFSGIDHVFAVLMPMRADFDVKMPSFLSDAPVDALAA